MVNFESFLSGPTSSGLVTLLSETQQTIQTGLTWFSSFSSIGNYNIVNWDNSYDSTFHLLENIE